MANETLNLELIFEKYGLVQSEVAEYLFPHNKCQVQALYRVLRGDAELDASQIAKLAKMCGVMVADLFIVSNPDATGLLTMNAKTGYEDGCITLTFGLYKAKINYNGVFITLFKNNQVVETVLTNAVETYTLPQLVEFIKKLIKKHE